MDSASKTIFMILSNAGLIEKLELMISQMLIKLQELFQLARFRFKKTTLVAKITVEQLD